MQELKLVVSTYDNDKVMEILLPMLENRFKSDFPEVDIEVIKGLEEKRPVFRGVKQWLEVFKLEWYYTPTDLVSKFKNTLKVM